ncbi:MAG TPA: phage tail protein [Aequorivita sp.]|jgi:phage tail-like protein|nr:phage tail protein [Aequorivita sp.]MBP40355.1 phage tail protein [Aequorivita sp.]HBC05727.1 phage tail protein [Aequorivita sp.]HNP67074.1 phage tail protein [Aequorivita sp.]|tara:strand:- start:163 stop:591 length:429 start_codon:yes stop_codon:yes gene_type:complete
MNEFLPVAFYFQLSFSDITANHTVVFKELSGISMEMNTEEISDNSFKHRVHPSAKFSNLVLKRGMASIDSEIVTWCLRSFNGNLESSIETKNIIVNLLDEARNILKSWSFVNAWPVKWAVSDLNSDNKIMIESLELAYGSFQ